LEIKIKRAIQIEYLDSNEILERNYDVRVYIEGEVLLGSFMPKFLGK